MADPTSPRIDAYGEKVTQQGYAWEERMMDGDYVAGLRYVPDEPEPYDGDDDREYDRAEMTFECRTCKKQWTDDRDDRPCPFCDSMDSHIVEGA